MEFLLFASAVYVAKLLAKSNFSQVSFGNV